MLHRYNDGSTEEQREAERQSMIRVVDGPEDGTLACDLDGTLAEQLPGPFDRDKIGPVVLAEMDRVLDALSVGRKVVIFTARAANPENIPPIRKWLEKQAEEYEYEPLGQLEITNVKSPTFSEIHDDRARQILPGGVMKSDAEVVAGMAKNFEEDQHPRDDHGRFTDGLDNSGVGAYVRSVGIKDAAEAEHGIRRTLQLIAETPTGEVSQGDAASVQYADIPEPVTQPAAVSPAPVGDREADAIRGDIGALNEVLASQGHASAIIPKLVNRDIPTWNIRGTVINSPSDMFAALWPVRSPYFETLKVAVLDKNNVVVHSQIVSVGGLDYAVVEPTALVGVLNQVRTATGKDYNRIMIAHNHPSGDPTPSSEDLAITTRCGKVAQMLGFDVVDHVITNGKKWNSLKEMGLMETSGAEGKGAASRIRRVPAPETPHGLAPWERVDRGEQMQIMQPDQMNEIVKGLRQSDPESGHAFYLSTKNHLVGVERISKMNDIGAVEILRKISAGATREGAGSVILDVSPLDAITASATLKRVQKGAELLGVKIHDGISVQLDGTNFMSYRTLGLMEEKSEEYGVSKTFEPQAGLKSTVLQKKFVVESVTFKKPLRKTRTVLMKVASETETRIFGRECDGDGVEFGPERTLEKRHVTLRKAIPIRYDLKTPSPVPQMTMPEQLKHLAGTAEDPTPQAQPDEFGRFPVDPTLRELKTPDRSTYEQGVDHAFKEEYIRNDVRGADQRKQDLPGA